MESLIDESMDIIPVAAPAAAAATPAEAPAEAPEPRELRRSATATPILSAAANAAITPGAISNAYASCGSTPGSSRRGSGNDFKLDAKASPKTPPAASPPQRPPMTAPGWIESEGVPAAASSTPSPAAPPSSSLSFGRFVGQQLGWEPDDGAADYDLEDDRRRRGVYNFLQVPWNLEPLLLFGFCTCLDAFVPTAQALGAELCGVRSHLVSTRREHVLVSFVTHGAALSARKAAKTPFRLAPNCLARRPAPRAPRTMTQLQCRRHESAPAGAGATRAVAGALARRGAAGFIYILAIHA